MDNIGLVLEGGGMKGIYTAGVLDSLMEEQIYLPYVIGVSAGACQGISYVSKQQGRNKNAIIKFIDDPRYISKKNLLLKGSIMDMDFIFNEIPNKYELFDYDSFFKNDIRCTVVITNAVTGMAEYVNGKEKNDKKYLSDLVRASSSLPLLTRPVIIDKTPYLDGGMADSIPIQKSIEDGNHKNIVVLTKTKGYRKKPSQIGWLYKKKYKDYPKLYKTLLNRYRKYNETMDFIETLEQNHQIIVIRPSVELKVSRIEKNKEKLEKLYDLGYRDTKQKIKEIKGYLSS